MSELEDDSNNSRPGLVVLVVITIVAVIAVGAVGYISGTGWFGYRQLLYGDGQVYLLNMSDKPLDVSVEGRDPVEVPPGDARTADLVGGQSRVVIRRPSGEVIDRREVFTDHSDALVKLAAGACLVASDVGAFYGRGGDRLEFVDNIQADQQVYIPGTTNVIWPRQSFPPKFDHHAGNPVWIELVACQLLGQPKFVRAYLEVRLDQRMKDADGR